MSYQLLHILSHGCILRKERGQLVMRTPQGDEKRRALEDLRAIIIAARGLSFSSDLLEALCSNGTVVLLCNERYCPCGIVAPLTHVVQTESVVQQCKIGSILHSRLWNRIVADKIENQANILRLFEISSGFPRPIGKRNYEEATAARYYWRKFFESLGVPSEIRDQERNTPINNMLNYGYAVLSALIHRSIVGHGLLPEIGFHHALRFAGYPLVYDLMEPFRPMVDYLLLLFLRGRAGFEDEKLFEAWCRNVATGLLQIVLKTPQQPMKLLYAIDQYIAMIADCLKTNKITPYWSPVLEKQSIQNGMDHNNV